MVEAKAPQIESETRSINLPPISEDGYNYLMARLGLDSPLNTTTELDEETWREKLSTVSNGLEELAREMLGERVFSRTNISLQRTIIQTIDSRLNNNRSMADGVLLGVALVIGAYDNDDHAISKFFLSPESLEGEKNIKDMVENVLPERKNEREYQTSLNRVPEIPGDNVYLKKLVEQITGINRNEKGEYQISNPLLIPPMEFYAGASIMHKILEDNWSQLQAPKASSHN